MGSVVLGKQIELEIRYYDGSGNNFNPPSVVLEIVRGASTLVFGPFHDEIINPSTGLFKYTLTIPTTVTPGNYSAKWITTDYNNDPKIDYVPFQIVDPPVIASGLLDKPRTYGILREAPRYSDMGFGSTDTIFFVGHADGLSINDPLHVSDMREAINILGADSNSPLLKALLEAYNSGARDIWITAAAPMNEYVSVLSDRFTSREEWGGINFYQRYYERLETTYSILRDFDHPEIIVPLEAPFYNSGPTDFLNQLVHHCNDSFANTGSPRIGIIGTRIDNWSSSDITAMANDSRLDNLAEDGKFVLIAVGEGILTTPQMPTGYSCSVAISLAATMATTPLNRSTIYETFPNMASLIGRDLTSEELDLLCRAKLNPAIRTKKGKRGRPYQVVMATDNTLAAHGSDFWSVTQLRAIAKVLQEVRTMGRRSIGSVGYAKFKQNVGDYLNSLVADGMIRGYDLQINRSDVNLEKVIVEIAIMPMFGIREIFFMVEVGNG